MCVLWSLDYGVCSVFVLGVMCVPWIGGACVWYGLE